MWEVSNPKLVNLEPEWAWFPGFSLLFENPGQSVTRVDSLGRVNCQVSVDPALGLYRALAEGVEELGGDALKTKFSLCRLPTESFHVTVFDGGNAGVVESMNPGHRLQLEKLLGGLPSGWDDQNDLVNPLSSSELTADDRGEIRFRYGRLFVWGNSVLAVRLEAADAESEANLDRLVTDRAKLSEQCRSEFGFGAGPKYTPHVSLGYFANESGGALAAEECEKWDELLKHKTLGLQIAFSKIRVFGFTDMATFFRAW